MQHSEISVFPKEQPTEQQTQYNNFVNMRHLPKTMEELKALQAMQQSGDNNQMSEELRKRIESGGFDKPKIGRYVNRKELKKRNKISAKSRLKNRK